MTVDCHQYKYDTQAKNIFVTLKSSTLRILQNKDYFFQIACMWQRVAWNVPIIWQTPLKKFNINTRFVIRLRYGIYSIVIDWCGQNLTTREQCLVKPWYRTYFTELNSAAGERKHVVEGQTDGPSWRPVTYQTNALCGKKIAHNVMPSISTVLLPRAHRYIQHGGKRRSVICL
jgi:hypothetical protein